jgi:TatA/E family protein of Tat protein translocase
MIGSLGVPELLFILVLALLVFGPKRLPEIGRTLGKGLAEFRKASNDLKRTINAELALEEEDSKPRPPQIQAVRTEPALPEAALPENVEARPAEPIPAGPPMEVVAAAPEAGPETARLDPSAAGEPAPAVSNPASDPAALSPRPIEPS